MLGDVVITKRTYVGSNRGATKLQTRCSNCGELFPAQYRRMGRIGTPRACEVRNIPQCSPCRSRYTKAQRARKAAAIDAPSLP